MRKIKFKAKMLDNNEWVYGSLIHLLQGDFIVNTDSYNEVQIDLHEKLKCNALWEENDFVKIDSNTICEFSGFCDLSGKDIYENDEFIPLYFAPFTSIEKVIKANDLDNDEMGIVKIECGQFVLKKRNGKTKPLCDYVEKEFDQYISNVGEIYKYKNNIVLGYVKR